MSLLEEFDYRRGFVRDLPYGDAGARLRGLQTWLVETSEIKAVLDKLRQEVPTGSLFSNSRAGSDQMTILASTPEEIAAVGFDFIKMLADGTIAASSLPLRYGIRPQVQTNSVQAHFAELMRRYIDPALDFLRHELGRSLQPQVPIGNDAGSSAPPPVAKPEPETATWSDIERALVAGTLESLDRATLEAFARVETPPSNNPTFHVRFNDAKQRIYRALDKLPPPSPPILAGGPPSASKAVVIQDDIANQLVFSDESREQGLPIAFELHNLPANFRQALTFRCALRVVSVLATRGNLQYWDPRFTKKNAECLIRALQAGLANCTNNSSRTHEQANALAVAERMAKRARRTVNNEDPRATTAMSLIALAANGGELYKAELILKLLHRQQFFYPGMAAAVTADYQALRVEAQNAGQWPAPAFFRRKLWPGEVPRAWVSDASSLNIALHTAGLAWAVGEYESWKAGEFEVAQLLRDLVEWAAAVSVRDDNDSASPEIEDEADDVAFAAEDLHASPRSAESHFGNDAVATVDTLSRRRLARVLAAFIRDKRTRRPLTLSVEGPWGSGKTTFMRLLEEELAQAAPPIRTIRFNPWRHQTQDELWAAFALQVTEAITEKLDWRTRFRKWRQLHAILFNWNEGWRDVAALLLRFPLWIVTFAAGVFLLFRGIVEAKDKDVLEAFMWGVPGATTFALSILIAWKKTSELLGSPFEIDLKRHLAKPNYEEKASFLAQFQAHFRDFCRIYVPPGETYLICIDDLDRCDAPKAAELMQAINLMLSDDAPFIYVLGMDRAKVAAGIAVKSRELLPFIYARDLAAIDAAAQEEALRTLGLEYGYEFIEKFIQLPFRLPPSETEDVRAFIRGRLTLRAEPLPPAGTPYKSVTASASVSVPASPPTPGTNPSATPAPVAPKPDPDESHLEAPLLFATRLLHGNPRRIAQLINLVRLQRLLAPELGVTVADGQLAKWTALALRWPLFILDLSQEPGLLAQLLTATEPANPSARFAHWRANPEFVNFVRLTGPGPNDGEEYRLNSPETIDALLRLGITVPLVRDSKVQARVGHL